MNDATDTIEKAPERPGYDALWLWFGLSRAAWLTLPRAMMHEMPDAWQADMARLLAEWDATWTGESAAVVATTRVQRVGERGRIGKWPDWVIDYRHPWRDTLAAAKQAAAPLITLHPGDPRRAAWLQHLRNTGKADLAQNTERYKAPFDVDADWPPESAEVLEAGGYFTIPYGTPEFASHVALLRKQGPKGIRNAMHIEDVRRPLTTLMRWGQEQGE
jgi:hypothetical protein